jgi:hypothetical protein
VAGDQGVEPQDERTVEHRGELDPLVAPHARVRGAPCLVRLDEFVHDVCLEALGEIPHVERDTQHIGGSPGVAGVLESAATASSAAFGVGRLRQRQVHAGHVVAGIHRTRGGDGRIDPA